MRPALMAQSGLSSENLLIGGANIACAKVEF